LSSSSCNIGPRDYKPSEIKRLFALSRNQCSEPHCTNPIIAEDGLTVIGKICHIEAANKKGPRFNDGMNNDQRRSYDNLILLCDEHHQIIDNKQNESKFRKELLLEWKNKHISETDSKFKFNEGIIGLLIENTEKYYQKIDSLDGPYEPKLSENYIERGDEPELIEILSKKKVLLLTGVSFCGKSEIAKRIAQHFFDKGYLFKRVLDTREASSFLESMGTERICILEDPFGHTVHNENRAELRLIKDLLNNIPHDNLLIITSRREVVHSVFNEVVLGNCVIDNHQWNDLTTDDRDFLKKVWSGWTKDSLILPDNFEKVNLIIDSDRIIQPGQLHHLSKLERLGTETPTVDELCRLAQIDIEDICNDILEKSGNLWEILVTIGLGADTKEGPTIQDLDYIMQGSLANLTLEPESPLGISKTLFGTGKKAFVLPTYSDSYGNLERIQDNLDFLERRGYLTYLDGRYSFSHPHYLEISKALVGKIGSIKKRLLASKIGNTLSCCNSMIAFNCAKNLEDLISHFEEPIQKELITIAITVGQHSYFPKVADQCALFLTRMYDNPLVLEHKSRIVFGLQSKSEEYGIMYVEGEPIRCNEADSLDLMFGFDPQKFTQLIEDLSEHNFLTTEEVWKGLRTVKNRTAEVDITLLEYASKSNEVFVRNLCSYLFFLNVQKFYDSMLLDKLLTDEHPSVVFNALLGYFQGMPDNRKELNQTIAERFSYFFENDRVFCIRSSTLMSNFSTDYAGECIDWREIPQEKHIWLWRVWAKYFVQFLKVLPTDVKFMHNPRFSGMMDKAKDMVYPKQGLGIAKKMLERLTKVSTHRLLENHEMHLVDFLISSTQSEPSLRQSIFHKFFNPDLPTYFVGYNLDWSLSQWKNLTDGEKQIILETLEKDREDLRWLRAIIVNRQIAPKGAIQSLIFQDKGFMERRPEWALDKLDKRLVSDIVTVFFGYDSALQNIGVVGSSIWVRNIVYQIARDNLPIFYEECLTKFIGHFINGVSRDELKYYKETWKKIYRNATDKNTIIDVVIRVVGKSSFCFIETSFLFKIMINYHVGENNIETLSSKLVQNFEALYYFTSFRDLFRVLNHDKFVQKYVFPKMPTQERILTLIFNLNGGELTTEETNQCVIEIIALTKVEDIKLQWIFELIEEMDNQNKLDKKLQQRLNEIPNKIREHQEAYHQKARSFPSIEMEGFRYYYKGEPV
jgi:hypothetical protein